MNSGIAMLLRSMGITIDPEQMVKDYEQTKKDIALWGGVIVALKEQMDRIEAQNAAMLAALEDKND